MRKTLLILMIITTIVIVCFAYSPSFDTGNKNDELKRERNYEVFFDNKLDKEEKLRIAQWIYEERVLYYRDIIKKLDFNIIVTLGLIAISIYLVRGNPNVFGIKSLNISIDAKWMYFVVPVGLLFFWLQFGFQMNSAIETRIALGKLIHICESEKNTGNVETVQTYYSNINTLLDNGILDTWFTSCSYLRDYYPRTALDGDEWTIRLVCGVLALYGLFYGLGHACIFSVFLKAEYRYRIPEQRLLKHWFTFLPIPFCIVIGLSHALFYFTSGHPNIFQLFVAIGAILFTFFLTTNSAMKIEKN